MKLTALVTATVTMFSAPAFAEAVFNPVKTESQFVEIVEGKDLTLFGISLSVSPEGKIAGRAFGRSVTGAWTWKDGFFCRDLYWGQRDLGPNCQEVRVNGKKIRFTSDRGEGRFADLTLRPGRAR
ncbi:MAG: dihydrodipicolinate reductase [Paracoccaceae bacterium]